MINDFITLMTEMGNYINSDSSVSYIETVSIRKYEKEDLPEFENYALIISPSKDSEELIANRTKMDAFELEIVCIVRNFHSSKSLIGTTSGEIGIIKMVKDIKASLFNFGEANSDDLNILYDEIEADIDFKFHKFPDRKEFFHEQVIPYSVRLKHRTF